MGFTCNNCHKTCKTDEGLYSHKLSKPGCSTCQYCGQSFTGRNQIRRHMKKKHMVFKCSQCTRRFFLSAGRATHERAKHGSSHRHDESHLLASLSSLSVTRPSGVTVGRTIFYQREEEGGFLDELNKHGSFEQMLVCEVNPDQEKLRICNEVVEYLMLFLQHSTKYSIREVVKGGSLGKGTSIKAKVDIDLSVFINDYNSVVQLEHNMRSVLKDLHDHILHDANWAEKMKFTRFTSHSIQFSLKINPGDEMNEVDLLPACDLGRGPRSIIFDRMSRLSSRDQSFYSVCFVKDQVEFVKQVPGSVKDLIRLVKHWKRTEHVNIVSYCIELIVIKQWMKMDEPTPIDLATGFKQVLSELTRLSTMKITWPTRYDINDYGGLPRPPAVMDPANPFMNVAGRIQEVEEIERKAKEMFQRL